MKSKNRLRPLLIGTVMVLLICAAVELIGNYKVMRLPKEQQGVYPLSAKQTVLENMTMTADGYLLDSDAESGSITWMIDRTYVGKFRYSINCYGLFDAVVKADTYNVYGNPTTKEVTDNSPMLVPESTVNLNCETEAVTITVQAAYFEGARADVLLSSPQIVNTAYINWYRAAIVFMLGMMVVLLYVFRTLFLDKLEFGFALVAMTVGLSMLICLPSIKVGWDEEAHFRAAYRLTALVKTDAMPQEILGHLLAGEYAWPLNPPGSYEETSLVDTIQNDLWENDADDVQFDGCTRGFATAGTIFQAGAIMAARVLNLSWGGFYFLGRLVNLLTYVISMFWVIRILPVGKRVTTFISLMPTSIFLAVCYTYDVVVYAFTLLGLAMILREWFRDDRKVSSVWMIIAYLFFMWGCFSKQVYAPLVLITWMIPGERFKSRGQMWLLKLLAGGVMVVLFGSLAIEAMMGSYGSGDSRGGSTVDNGTQMQLILAQPFSYAVLLLKHMWKTLYSYTIGGSVFRAMGHLPDAGFEHLIPIAAVGVMMVDQENTEKFRRIDRIAIFILCAGVAAIVWSALYVQFNSVGATTIGGVQARYYRPFLPLLYMVFGNRLLMIRTTERRINAALLGVCGLIMGGTALQVLNLFRI